jgi:hypothetical protein
MRMPKRPIKNNPPYNWALPIAIRHLLDFRRGHNIVMIVPTKCTKGKTWRRLIGPVSHTIRSRPEAFRPYITESDFNVSIVTMLQPEVIERQCARNNELRANKELAKFFDLGDSNVISRKRGPKTDLTKEMVMMEDASDKYTARAFAKKHKTSKDTLKRLIKQK